MTKKLVIILSNTDPRNGEEVGAPIFQAAVAASMGYEVEVLCTGSAGRLMKEGVAAELRLKAGDQKTVLDHIRDAHAAGVRFICSSPSLDLFDMTRADLIAECDGVVGGAYMIEEIMEGDAKVLTY